MAKKLYNSIEEEVRELKAERKAVIVAHNYQVGEIQDIADFTGDSLNLARWAAKTDAEVIVFCGVHFMAETSKILSPEKLVLIPDLSAGCSLADMVTPEEVRAWKKAHPGGLVVCYINTSAAVKAECDYCCTSSNAEKIVRSIPEGKEVLFVPDFYLGSYVRTKTGRPIHLWKGYCGVHTRITPDLIMDLRVEHPDAEFLMHPECGCLTKTMHLADKILSTEGMVQYAQQSPANEFIIATETGILHRMEKDNPQKKFYPAAREAVCGYMKQNTLEKVVLSLERLQYQVEVDPEIARRARLCLDRMLAIS